MSTIASMIAGGMIGSIVTVVVMSALRASK